MTKPNLDEKLTELSAKYQTDKPDFCGVDLGQHEAFMAGAQAALEALRDVPGEFDEALSEAPPGGRDGRE